MATIDTEVRLTMKSMSPLVAAVAYGIVPGHDSTFEDFVRFVDGHYARAAARPRYDGNRHERRAAAARVRKT